MMSRLPASLVLLVGLGFGPAAAASIEVRTQTLVLQFAANGDLLEARACLPDCDSGRHQTVLGGVDALVSFASYAAEPFELHRSQADGAVLLDFQHAPGSYRRWRIPADGWRLGLETAGAGRIDIRAGTGLEAPDSAGFGVWLEQPRYMWRAGRSYETHELADAIQPFDPASWFGFRNRFWAVMAQASGPLTANFETGPELRDPGVVLGLEPAKPQRLDLYVGPLEPAALRSADPALPGMLYASLWFWLRWICMGLFWLLSLIHALVPHWALDIMLLSVAVNILMRPLSLLADHLQDDVHRTEGRLAPELREIRAKYRGEEQSERVLALYKKHGVHPLYSLKSLAGVAVVIPVFIGAFDMLAENIWLAGEKFLWIGDLARPDALAPLPFDLPFFGNELNLLPFIMTALSVAASVLHRHEAMDALQYRRHKRNLTLMALGFLALFYTFPAGMVLYWTTNNLISVIKYGWKRMHNAASEQS